MIDDGVSEHLPKMIVTISESCVLLMVGLPWQEFSRAEVDSGMPSPCDSPAALHGLSFILIRIREQNLIPDAADQFMDVGDAD